MIPWASQPSHESSKSWTYWTSGTNIHELREISTPANRCKVAGEAMGGKTLAALLSQKTGCYKATWRNFDQILLSFDEVIVLFMCCHSLPLFCVLVACARSASSAAKIHVNTCSKTLASQLEGPWIHRGFARAKKQGRLRCLHSAMWRARWWFPWTVVYSNRWGWDMHRGMSYEYLNIACLHQVTEGAAVKHMDPQVENAAGEMKRRSDIVTPRTIKRVQNGKRPFFSCQGAPDWFPMHSSSTAMARAFLKNG